VSSILPGAGIAGNRDPLSTAIAGARSRISKYAVRPGNPDETVSAAHRYGPAKEQIAGGRMHVHSPP
jgi:hypothetical protein